MSDKMMFPENIDDFLSGFAFKDSEEIYTNGSMLIPLFRVQQAFEHYSTEIRNKAIDDFVKECEAEYDNDGCPDVSDYLDYKLSLREIFEIAERLKEGSADNE